MLTDGKSVRNYLRFSFDELCRVSAWHSSSATLFQQLGSTVCATKSGPYKQQLFIGKLLGTAKLWCQVGTQLALVVPTRMESLKINGCEARQWGGTQLALVALTRMESLKITGCAAWHSAKPHCLMPRKQPSKTANICGKTVWHGTARWRRCQDGTQLALIVLARTWSSDSNFVQENCLAENTIVNGKNWC